MRIAKAALAAAMLGSVLFSGAAAFGAGAPGTPAGGALKLFATPKGNGLHSSIVITGAIGDYGQALSINKNGTANANGDYVKITLKKGTFEINSATLNAKFKNAQPTVNKATCSAQFTGTGPVTLFGGTGLYTGVTGTVRVTETYAVVGPLFTSGKNKGQCNLSNNAQPVAQYSSIQGTGAVKFS